MHDFMLILHFIGLVMALGAGFSNLFLGIVTSKLEPAERGAFMSKTVILATMGRIGLGLLILTGLYLITPYWATLSAMPMLIAKLVLAGLLLIMVITISVLVNKAMKQGNVGMLAKIRSLAMINFLLGIAIVILAVLTFH